jgi:signal transduction histidine kinase
MIKQVVINLIKNAIEALENRSDATLTVVTEMPGEGEVRLVVADNGSGMSEETQKDLFSPFFTTKIGGVGLGLSVSQRIVRQHGGRIRVASRIGEGTQFTVVLPANADNEPAESNSAQAEAEEGVV